MTGTEDEKRTISNNDRNFRPLFNNKKSVKIKIESYYY